MKKNTKKTVKTKNKAKSIKESLYWKPKVGKNLINIIPYTSLLHSLQNLKRKKENVK